MGMAIEPEVRAEVQTQAATQPAGGLSLEEIQLAAQCNWCLNPLTMSGDTFNESNFVDTQKQYHGGIGQAVYCVDCLASPNRVADPKSVIDRTTLQVSRYDELP